MSEQKPGGVDFALNAGLECDAAAAACEAVMAELQEKMRREKPGSRAARALAYKADGAYLCALRLRKMHSNDQLKPPRDSAVGLEAPVGREDEI